MASLINRGGVYHLQWMLDGKAVRKSLRTSSVQVAKEHLRRFEDA